MSEYSRVRHNIYDADNQLMSAISATLDPVEYMRSYPTLPWGDVAKHLSQAILMTTKARAELSNALDALDKAQNSQ